MDKDEIRNIIKKYSIVLTKYLEYKKVILFGSYRNGIPNKFSDIDVAVLVNKSVDYYEGSKLLWKVTHEVDDRIEPVLIIEGNDPSGFLDDILKNGEVIASN